MNTFSIKSVIFMLTALLLIAGGATAQNARGDRDGFCEPPDAESRVAHITAQLGLSDQQSASMLELMQAVDLERQAIQDAFMQQMEPELCELQLRTESEVGSILTEAQLAAHQTRQEAHGRNRNDAARRSMHNLDCSAYE